MDNGCKSRIPTSTLHIPPMHWRNCLPRALSFNGQDMIRLLFQEKTRQAKHMSSHGTSWMKTVQGNILIPILQWNFRKSALQSRGTCCSPNKYRVNCHHILILSSILPHPSLVKVISSSSDPILP